MNRLVACIMCVGLLPVTALAVPYWVSYEANDGLYPEEVGWDRLIYGPPADRWFEDGALVIDGTASIETADFYRMDMDGHLDPGPDEMFVARWRLFVDEVTAPQPDPEDPIMGIYSDDAWSVLLLFGENHVASIDNPAETTQFAPHVWHSFEFRSADMRTYELWVDDAFAFSGDFTHVVSSSRVSWGDGGQGPTSISRWEYVEFGVIPEPGTGAGLFFVAALFGRALR